MMTRCKKTSLVSTVSSCSHMARASFSQRPNESRWGSFYLLKKKAPLHSVADCHKPVNLVLLCGETDCEKLINTRTCQRHPHSQATRSNGVGVVDFPSWTQTRNKAEPHRSSRARLDYPHWFLMGGGSEHPQGRSSVWRLREGKGDKGVAICLVTWGCCSVVSENNLMAIFIQFKNKTFFKKQSNFYN